MLVTPRNATREAAGAAQNGEPASIQARLPGMAPIAGGDELGSARKAEHTFVFPVREG